MIRLAWMALVCIGLLVGCGALRKIHDRFTVDPLSPSAFHQKLTGDEQCLHCHTELKNAPEVPHPQYERCATCHVVGH